MQTATVEEATRLLLAGRARSAAQVCEILLAASPADARAWNLLGMARLAGGDTTGAADCLAKATDLDPQHAGYFNNLGFCLLRLGQARRAETSLSRAVALAPSHAGAWNNLGRAAAELGRHEQARDCHRRALAIHPGDAMAWRNLARAYLASGDLDSAGAAGREALRLQPDDPHNRLALAEFLNDLGLALTTEGRLDAGEASYREALTLAPDHPVIHQNLGLTLLAAGQLAEGWSEFRWRLFKTGRPFGLERFVQAASPKPPSWLPVAPSLPMPEWRGEGLRGRTILLWAEQGIGDEVMYSGVVPELLDAGAHCVLETISRLEPLFKRSFPQAEVLVQSVPPHSRLLAGDIDFHASSGSATALRRRNRDDFPVLGPWLRADPTLSLKLRENYRERGDELLVGIAWGSVAPNNGARRSADLAFWTPLLRTPGVRFIDLQYGDTQVARELVAQNLGVAIVHDDEVDQLADLDAFAAQVAAMDLVISVANTTAHMAGALGVPSWVLLSAAADWRWFDDDRARWYADARLFRQRRAGDWPELFERVAAELAIWLGGH